MAGECQLEMITDQNQWTTARTGKAYFPCIFATFIGSQVVEDREEIMWTQVK